MPCFSASSNPLSGPNTFIAVAQASACIEDRSEVTVTERTPLEIDLPV